MENVKYHMGRSNIAPMAKPNCKIRLKVAWLVCQPAEWYMGILFPMGNTSVEILVTRGNVLLA